MREGDDRRLQQREVSEVAAVERQLLDRARIDQITEFAAAGVDRGRLCRGRLLGRAADGHRQVDDRGFADRRGDTAAARSGRNRSIRRESVAARRRAPAKRSVLARRTCMVRCSPVSCCRTVTVDAGESAAAGVDDVPGQSGRRLARCNAGNAKVTSATRNKSARRNHKGSRILRAPAATAFP